MLNSKSVREDVIELLSEESKQQYINIIGVLGGLKMRFDQSKLAEKKPVIATVLRELGASERPYTTFASLTTYKNGQKWNELKTYEDFQALELLVACSEACGFLYNGACVIQKNMQAIGSNNAALISDHGRSTMGDDAKWTQIIRDKVASRVMFETNPEDIEAYAYPVPEQETQRATHRI